MDLPVTAYGGNTPDWKEYESGFFPKIYGGEGLPLSFPVTPYP